MCFKREIGVDLSVRIGLVENMKSQVSVHVALVVLSLLPYNYSGCFVAWARDLLTSLLHPLSHCRVTCVTMPDSNSDNEFNDEVQSSCSDPSRAYR